MSSEESDQQEDFTWEAYYKSLEGREMRPLFTDVFANFGVKIIAKKRDA